ncbi:MAG TPA: IclR family transcriptional regulator [Advenella sp.]|nr:IclR family transcriptional regulator [Advenella sp.]
MNAQSALDNSTVATPARNRERRQSVQAADTVVAVLKGLASLGGGASLTALAAQLDENPAKVHRYLVSLIDGGLVTQNANTQQYTLGLESMLIGLAAMRQADPIRIAEPALIHVREHLSITSFIAVMGNKGPTIVRMEEPSLPVTVNVRVGSVLSFLWSATGRVFLGLHDEPAVRALARQEFDALSQTQAPPAPFDALVAQLHDEISRSQCICVRDTNLKGISAVAAPIYNYAGQLTAVLTALGASGGFDTSLNGSIAIAVRQQAQRISQQLGYSIP